ncbi:MAG: hypothetical protein WD021_02650 [Rhodothermales bacterium]
MLRIITLLVVLAATGASSPVRAQPIANSPDLAEQLRQLSPMAADDVLWLARCIYSESDRADEQRLVAWVVRNRVETQFRGRSYREVILEASQFSAFNEPTPRRRHILNLTASSTYGPWQSALGVALDVYQAPEFERPFPVTVRHFYSPVSMRGGLPPHWADDGTELSSDRLGVDPHRFRFFNNVDEGSAWASAGNDAAAIGSDDGTPGTGARAGSSGGFLFPVRRGSGRVARPARPSVRRSDRP